ncbi:sulfurtransferase [Paludibacterium paludis]|uniref:Sulfurtransferase n=1 Tax=Paludibacterium paludis TaxID=1225769 RepID=A0A918P0J5_9NEIS|nr:sulfurtransferase [Paludibacterium paludis]GGY09972.1 sulfurtransferase [Paludibacterium paludis]
MTIPLIDVETLNVNAERVIFDCRFKLEDPGWGERAWREGHIPGARYLSLDRDLSGKPDGRNGRHPLPLPAQLAERLGAAGVGADTEVVVYDDMDGRYAARAWVLLRWLGHDRAVLLDGGLPAWIAAGGRLETETPECEPTIFPIRASRLAMVTANDVETNLSDRTFVVIDARSPARYAGEGETLDPVGGHIPGALNRYLADNTTTGQRFKPPGMLAAEWRALIGERDPASVVHQCGSGVTACHNLLAMECAGLAGSRLYPGSWSEWCSDSARPVATGPDPE